MIFVIGNGGSAATAAHFVCDLVKCASFQRDLRFQAIALADSTPTVTAYSNDVGYDCIFEEQLKNLARAGDVVLAMSGSGNSPNVLRAVKYAKAAGCSVITFTGRDGGKLAPSADLDIRVPVPHMGRIEDTHMALAHMIAYYFIESDRTTL
jgi:D-sedoheptulose 7-phosphate isomerase